MPWRDGYIIESEFDNAILFVGRLSKDKNISLLLKALEGTKYRLDVVGDGKEKTNLEDCYIMLRIL